MPILNLRKLALAALTGALVVLPLASPAAAARASLPLNSFGWWWSDAESEETDVLGNKVVVEGTNPYCPATSGTAGAGGAAVSQEACHEGRLPIWVRNGDFERPVMSFALDIDTSMLAGADLEKLTVTLLEADCDPADGRKDTPQCQQLTSPVPADNPASQGKDEFESSFRVEVCSVTEIFGEGEARPVDERPRYECGLEIYGERKLLRSPVTKTADAETPTHLDDHVWTFDLTELAQKWVEEFTIPTAVLFRAEPPRNPKTSDQFRVVFAGVKDKPSRDAENVQKQPGVEIEAVFSGGGGGFPDIPGTGSGTDTGFTDTGTDTGFTDTGSTATTDFGTDTALPTTPEPVASPEAGPAVDLAGAPTGARGEPLPGYVWLGVLAGLAAFSLVRSVVIPATAGIRPDGVLAQIQALNAQRRGTSLADAAASGPSVLERVGGGLSVVRDKVVTAIGKIGHLKK